MQSRKRKSLWIVLIVLIAVPVLCASAFLIYAGVYYHADADAVNAYRGEYMSQYSWAELTAGKLWFVNNS